MARSSNHPNRGILFFTLTHLCPGEDYWVDFFNFLNFLHMNPKSDDF